MYYVEHHMQGRKDFYALVQFLNQRGYTDTVEYCSAKDDKHCPPHLKFNDQADAVAFCLTFGGVVSKSVPYYKK